MICDLWCLGLGLALYGLAELANFVMERMR